MAANKVFNVAVFFVVFRECLEAAVIVSVLLSFLKQSIGSNDMATYKRLRMHVWIGVVAGFIICMAIGGGFIGAYYRYENDIFGSAEDLWEGVFCIIATLMISVMGIAMLRVNKMQAKWRVKIAKAMLEVPKDRRKKWSLKYWATRYSMFLLPFITVLREGLEAVVFVAGAGITTKDSKATAYPLPVVIGLIAGIIVGTLLYYGTSKSSLQIFLVISTCVLYLIASGLFSRGVWYFDNYYFNKKTGGDASESGDGNGSYNILRTVYHVNCCNPELDNGWDIFNSLLGWQNTGYLSSILAYNLYWLVLMIVIGLMMYEERNGHLPFCKNLKLRQLKPSYYLKRKQNEELTAAEQEELFKQVNNLGVDEEGNVVVNKGDTTKVNVELVK
ncbi:high-affinity iron permease FTR1 [Kluyveromyces lactis]|uniref:KLLA0A03025p n=1 Tax=Kluyveromyces lactis (strain ATCC 8585 / CBS 2359 / DSM 70799 / NBRC 1267 / NRRL Y-1140 / WM37) TaxID=284590 RepID=Q6CY57_KLULA|nr:uncharacterized protein KLLA0_A03025g [Kluyveromyces lactis]CAH02720.1 KLLA0A03025p [Kluyveromyces lactis]|eukprot:XP_451132.1 uncharacterized protein KLLA0_A03025g [Kluyveromyces lactis]